MTPTYSVSAGGGLSAGSGRIRAAVRHRRGLPPVFGPASVAGGISLSALPAREGVAGAGRPAVALCRLWGWLRRTENGGLSTSRDGAPGTPSDPRPAPASTPRRGAAEAVAAGHASKAASAPLIWTTTSTSSPFGSTGAGRGTAASSFIAWRSKRSPSVHAPSRSWSHPTTTCRGFQGRT